MYKKHKPEVLLISFIFLGFLWLNSSWWAWYGGASFGPRHLYSTTPFLTIPLIYFLRRKDKKKIWNRVFLALMIVSILINFTGLQHLEDTLVSEDRITISKEYQEKTNSLQVLANPIKDYYLPLFLKHGPRSGIFESVILRNYSFEIRGPYRGKPSVPFLVLVAVAFLILLIWGLINKKTVLFLILVLGTLIITYSNRYRDMEFAENWHDKVKEEEVRWMSNSGKIKIYNQKNTIQKNIVKFYVKSYYKDRDIQIFLNGEYVDNFVAFKEGTEVFSPILNLKPGVNLLLFESLQSCDLPAKIEKSDDLRCLSIGIKSISIVPLEKIKNKILAKNWYDKQPEEEFRWMKNNGTIQIYNYETVKKTVKLKFYVKSNEKDRLIHLYLNDKLIDTFWAMTQGTEVFSPTISIDPGMNTLVFQSSDPCTVPLKDTRCLSLGINQIFIVPWEEVQSKSWDKILAKNWYDKQPHEELRWMKNNGTIHIFNLGNKTISKKVAFIGRSYYENKTVLVYFNGKLLEKFQIPPHGLNFFRIQVDLQPGENKLELYAQEGCLVVKEVEGWDDIRCLSFGLEKIYFEE